MPPADPRTDLTGHPIWPGATSLPAAWRPEWNSGDAEQRTRNDADANPRNLDTFLDALRQSRDEPDPPSPAPQPTVIHLPAERLRPRRGVELTPRDVALLRNLVRLYGLTAEQVHRRHFGALRTAANRLAALTMGGYVRLRRPWYRGPGVYLATALGARVAGLDLPAPRFSRLAIGHHLTVADLAQVLVNGCPGASWVAERELRSEAMAAIRERRGRLTVGCEHVPDGLLVLSPPSAGRVDGETVAVELELTKKGRGEYRRILRWYGAALRYRRVAWFCGTARIRERLEEMVQSERVDDFTTVHPLPAGVTVPNWE